MKRTKELEAFALLVVNKIKEKGDAIYAQRRNTRDLQEQIALIAKSAGHEAAAIVVLDALGELK